MWISYVGMPYNLKLTMSNSNASHSNIKEKFRKAMQHQIKHNICNDQETWTCSHNIESPG